MCSELTRQHDSRAEATVLEETMAAQGPINVQQTVVIGNTKEEDKIRGWSTGLCDCCSDCGTFFCGFFCLPCLMCQVSQRLGENCCLPIFCDGGLLALRTKIRVKYNIQGTICNDACLLCCCTQLAVCQMNRELNHVGL